MDYEYFEKHQSLFNFIERILPIFFKIIISALFLFLLVVLPLSPYKSIARLITNKSPHCLICNRTATKSHTYTLRNGEATTERWFCDKHTAPSTLGVATGNLIVINLIRSIVCLGMLFVPLLAIWINDSEATPLLIRYCYPIGALILSRFVEFMLT